jgi:PKD repeat protein
MKMYRNYDGNKSTFGDTSVATTVPNPDNVAAFSATRSADGALTVMVISKYLSGSTPATINLANFASGGTAQVWQLTASNTINHLSDITFSGSSFNVTLPQQSITLFVIPAGNGNQPPVAAISATPISGLAPLTVSFNGSSSSDPDGTIASYAWDFGDSTGASGVTASHTYNTAGSYTARLRVTDDYGATASKTVVITVTAPTPAAPTSLSGTAASASQVNLAWTDNASNEDGFKIERCTGTNCTSFAQVATVGANVRNYSNTGLSKNTVYTYRVRAYNSFGNSGYSNSVGVRTARK